MVWMNQRAGANLKLKELLAGLPSELKRMIGSRELVRNTLGCSSSFVFYVQGLKCYLKIAPYNDLEPLAYEVKVLEWLQGRLPVPKVHYYEKLGDKEFLLMSEIEGRDCTQKEYLANPKDMVRCLAEGLRQIHSIDISGCPLDQTLSFKLQKARLNVERGLVDEDDFEDENRGLKAAELYAKLLEGIPGTEDLVFSHGDYCLPNIILKGSKVSGFIDLGRAGVADRYQDIALAIRSLRHNLGSDDWTGPFLQIYGIGDADQSKIDFYILLDEFF